MASRAISLAGEDTLLFAQKRIPLDNPTQIMRLRGELYVATAQGLSVLKAHSGRVLAQVYIGSGVLTFCPTMHKRVIALVPRDIDGLCRLNAKAGELLTFVPVGAHPRSLCADLKGEILWVACAGKGSVEGFSADTLDPLHQMDVPGTVVCARSNGGRLWALSGGDYRPEARLSLLDPLRGGVVYSVHTTGAPTDMVVVDAHYICIALHGGITLLESASGQVVWSNATGGLPYSLSVQGNKVWACDAMEGQILCLSLADGSILQRIDVGKEPAGIYISA